MASIKIPAREIRTGDVVDVLGMKLLVKPGNRAADKHGIDLYLRNVAVTITDLDLEVTVERETEEKQS